MHNRSHTKMINDPVHGHYQLSRPLISIIDTPHFQRLRGLKQLGTTYFVFPGASHNRFEHSLGVAHLSGRFLDKLRVGGIEEADDAELFENERVWNHERTLVQVAGLVHDLGHGCFSHLFDHCFLKRCPGVLTENEMTLHEKRSVMLFEDLVDEFGLDFDRDEVRHVSDLITAAMANPAEGASNIQSKPKFLYQIVANGQSGMDTDKFDYLARDVKNLGMSFGFDHERLMHFSKVVGGNISFHRREIYNVYDLFLSRFKLHRLVYNHRTTVAIDAMMTDILLAADPVLKISDSINDPKEFLRISDAILPIIEYSSNAALAPAQRLIARLRRRSLYRFVDEFIVPDAYADIELSEEEITSCQDAGGYDLKPQDIYVTWVVCNLGMNSKNPVEHVHFHGDDQAWYAGVEKVIPKKYEERLIRVYTRCEDKYVPDVKDQARRAFRKYLRHLGIPQRSGFELANDVGKQNGNSSP